MSKQEPIRAWELAYDSERDALVMHFLDVEMMKDGFAKIAGEIVSASKLALTPEEAKTRCIERIEESRRELEETRDRVARALRMNGEILETAKKFPVLQAAQAAIDKATETPAILLPRSVRE